MSGTPVPPAGGSAAPTGAVPQRLTFAAVRPLLDALADAIVMIGSDEVIVGANAAACALVGLGADQVRGARLADFLPEDVDYGAARSELLSAGKASGVVRLRLADRRIHDIHIDAHAHLVAPDLHLLVLRDVSDRSRFRTALQRSMHRFQAVFDGIADALLVLTPEDGIRDANAAAAAILGKSREQLLGQPLAPHLADAAILLQARARLAAEGRAEGQLAVKDESTGTSYRFTLTNSGDPQHTLMILRPAASKPGADEEEAEPLFRRLFEDSPAPGMVFDLTTGRIADVNQAAIAEYGYTRDEFLGLALEALRPDAANSGKGHGQGGLWRQRRKDGSLIEADVTVTLVGPEGGEDRVLVSHAPVQHSQVSTQFGVSVELFDAIAQGVIITDSALNILAINPAFTRITGYSREECLGRNPRLMSSGRHDGAFYEAMWKTIRETGQWQGEIWNRRKNGEIFPEWLTISAVKNRLGEVVQYLGMFTDISERKAAQARIEYLAHYDALTGLPNRALLQERFRLAIAQARRGHRRVGVMFLDLDRFKKVNDTLGHSAGDTVLQETARRLRSCLRESDFVGRQGGDEFIVLIGDVDVIDDAAHVAQKIIGAMAKPIEFQGHTLHISPSIGISLYPDDGIDAEVLLKNADIAMYQAKSAGRNNYQFFAPDMNETALHHMAFENSLRLALEGRQFLLHYQPRLSLADGAMVGVEALIRWRHPDRGVVGPAQFINVAEESGLIVPMDAWVLDTACAQASQWQQALGHALRVSVNVSALQFRHRDFVQQVRDTLARNGIDAVSLELELTESVLIDDPDAAVAKLRALKDIGVGLAIDDFGTGYSSLAYLKRFPIDRLKIDQSFVGGIGVDHDAETIIVTTAGMARSLDLKIVAEGVETAEQLKFLQALACDEVQGYLFSPPAPAATMPALMQTRRRSAT